MMNEILKCLDESRLKDGGDGLRGRVDESAVGKGAGRKIDESASMRDSARALGEFLEDNLPREWMFLPLPEFTDYDIVFKFINDGSRDDGRRGDAIDATYDEDAEDITLSLWERDEDATFESVTEKDVRRAVRNMVSHLRKDVRKDPQCRWKGVMEVLDSFFSRSDGKTEMDESGKGCRECTVKIVGRKITEATEVDGFVRKAQEALEQAYGRNRVQVYPGYPLTLLVAAYDRDVSKEEVEKLLQEQLGQVIVEVDYDTVMDESGKRREAGLDLDEHGRALAFIEKAAQTVDYETDPRWRALRKPDKDAVWDNALKIADDYDCLKKDDGKNLTDYQLAWKAIRRFLGRKDLDESRINRKNKLAARIDEGGKGDVKAFKEKVRKSIEDLLGDDGGDHFWYPLNVGSLHLYLTGEFAEEMGDDGKPDRYACLYLTDRVDSDGYTYGEILADGYCHDPEDSDGYVDYFIKRALEVYSEKHGGKGGGKKVDEAVAKLENVTWLNPSLIAYGVELPRSMMDNLDGASSFTLGRRSYLVIPEVTVDDFCHGGVVYSKVHDYLYDQVGKHEDDFRSYYGMEDRDQYDLDDVVSHIADEADDAWVLKDA